jgi:cell division protein FtsL
MSLRPSALSLLLLVVVVSAVCVVFSKHQGRKLFIELQALEYERDAMDVEWGQLQLEQSTLTTQGQVEVAARDRLGMVVQSADNMVIVRP